MQQLTTLARDSRALAALAVPLALTQLAQVALTTTDTIMMGVLGTESLAAGGLALVIFNQLRTMGVGLVTSVGNQVAAAAARAEAANSGAEQADDEVRGLVRAALAVATLAGIAGAVLMILIGQAATLLGQAAAVAHRTQGMLAALAPGLLPCLWFQAIRQFTVGMRRPQALLQITLVSVAVNAALNWAFIHGSWGFPELGLTGIGVATSCVHLLSFLALYGSARRDPQLAPLLSLNAWKADAPTVRRLLGLGTPIAATYGSEAGFFSVTALLAGSFGAAALAAHTAVNQLIYIVFQVAVGLSHAASINVSRELALGEYAAARRIRSTALACGAAVMAVVGTLYLALPHLVLSPYFDPSSPDDQQGLSIATGLLAVVAVLQFFDCAQNIGVGLLRGLDDTKSGFRITLIGYWLVGLPAAWVFAYPLGGETRGLWLGLLTGLATTAVLLLRRYNQSLATRADTPAPGVCPV
ncbi:MATE family efflux transporter [Kitasatospora aureofaciens]|uniref:MATE family efflux transporter n=1 Tax=Kitasatospora aureofaciens TaxID=1894 RepID=UPI001C44915E|nr:MATE family efflux transporter [Kitasatospora aureofaciens]MBV6702371.1 MATE family efflux transporter [Kitasatospora aureofaciens]